MSSRSLSAARSRGLSLIELMIAITLGMVVVGALIALYVNITRNNNEMAKTNRQIENGRFAIQLLQDDVVHAGFWGEFVPQFDDLTGTTTPLDAPTALPDPCLTYNAANWNATYIANLIGIPVQGNAGTCTLTSQKANTDVLVVRHATNCVAGVGNCEADTPGKLYFQSTQCENEVSGLAQGGSSGFNNSSITLAANASSTTDFYKDATVRIIAGPGVGQSGMITAYNGSSKVATVNTTWPVSPNNSSVYAFGFGYVLGTNGYIFHKRNCTTAADKRKFVSNLYYIRDYAVTPGDGIPTLMQSTFDNGSQQGAQALIEGIEGFRVLYGIDSLGKTGAPTNYLAAVAWADPANLVTPTNRGNGLPDGAYVTAANVSCTSAAACNAANVVSVKIYVLARNLESTPGYTDTKTYQLGDPSYTLGPFNDGFKRHVFSTTVRLVNPAGRRDTP